MIRFNRLCASVARIATTDNCVHPERDKYIRRDSDPGNNILKIERRRGYNSPCIIKNSHNQLYLALRLRLFRFQIGTKNPPLTSFSFMVDHFTTAERMTADAPQCRGFRISVFKLSSDAIQADSSKGLLLQ